MNPAPFRILTVDDNPAIHSDFRKILCADKEMDQGLDAAEAGLFGEKQSERVVQIFELDSARQGQEALEMVRKANEEGRPYALAFMDVRMPPGWDGVETTVKLWEVSPDLQVVICTAYSDYDLEQMTERFKHSDRFVILKKPFDAVEARQLAAAFTRKWQLHIEEKRRQEQMTQTMRLRTAELMKSEERYRVLFDSSPVPAWVYERKSLRILAVNNAALAAYGYGREEFEAKTLADIRLADAPPLTETAAQSGSRKNLACHDRHRKKDGTVMDVQISAYPVIFQGWDAELVLAEDVTERKRTEEALRQSEEQFRAAMEHSAIGMALVAPDGKWLKVNQALCQIVGYTEPELLTTNFQSITHPDDLNADLGQVGRMLKREIGTYQMEKRYFHKDGRIVWVLLSVSLVSDAAGQPRYFVSQVQDITDRKQGEAERKEIEKSLAYERELLRTLLDNVPERIYFKDRESRFIHASASKVRKTVERVPRLKARYEELVAKQCVTDEVATAGMELLVGLTDFDLFANEHAQAAFQDEQAIIRTGVPVIGKLEKETHFDGSISWSLTSKLPWYDKEGKTLGTFGISLDVTALKQAEAEAKLMEVQLRQAQKLEAVGQLAAGIAHEINTPTQYVGDNTRFLQDSFESIVRVLGSHKELIEAVQHNAVTPELTARVQQTLAESELDYLFEQVPAAIRETLEGVERVTKIVRAMKEFSHPGTKEKMPADLNKAIETTVTVARNEWKYVADLDLDLDPTLPLVPCFLGEFNQAILNLVVNAAQAVGDVAKQQPGTKGKITIRTRRDGDVVEVRVSDTGTGIPEAARPHIFEPFFTTKDVGKGTGQGLSLIYGSVVKKHGGTVDFETETGKGTTFILRLPITPRGVEPLPKAA